ncbi:hypothetical protein NPIL_225011 [Nephila pilipes]|uniref:Uncharacterized protein n=1 Tax=Nephila pilipes TaxID=299642 RepID=A0A8X6TPW9_NEPPI|nr:hypothetical protein NPIL_225011 [Nephila pilipes]
MMFIPTVSHRILCVKAIFGRCLTSADGQIFISRFFCSSANGNVKVVKLDETPFIPQERTHFVRSSVGYLVIIGGAFFRFKHACDTNFIAPTIFNCCHSNGERARSFDSCH